MCTFTERFVELISGRLASINGPAAGAGNESEGRDALTEWLDKSSMGKLLGVIHPFLLAMAPIVFLYSRNMHQAQFLIALVFMGWALCITGALFAIALLWQRNAVRAALVVSAFNALFFMYGKMFDWLMKHQQFDLPYSVFHGLLLTLSLTVVVAWGVALKRSVFNPVPVARFLSLTIGILLSFSMIKIVHHSVRIALTANRHAIAEPATDPDASRTTPIAESASEKPDVYYIILDGYACRYVATFMWK